MKKFLLSVSAFAIVAVSAIAVAPTTAEAIPAFARQTGAACLSCHYQSFPALAAFGREFKKGAFTDVGDEALIEDENLSIPAVLNATFVVRGSFDRVKDSNNANLVPARKVDFTDYAFPRDTVLLLAGRIGTNTGAFIEFDGTTPAANWQLMNSWDFGGFKAGINIANTGFGWTAPLEVSNVFGQHGGLLNGKNISAANVIMTNNGLNSLGIAAWAGNDLVTAQIGLYAPTNAGTGAVGAGIVDNAAAPGVRVFFTPEVAGMDAGVGFGYVGGNVMNVDVLGANAAQKVGYTMWFVDAQLQGEIGDSSFGLYADWANAPAKANGNVFANGMPNGNVNNKVNGFSIRGTLKPLHNVVFALGYGTLREQPRAAVATRQKSYLAAAEYELYQNAVISLIYENTKDPIASQIVGTNAGTGQKEQRIRLEWEALM